MKEISIFCFGDSISFGQEVSVQDTWVCQLATALNNEYPFHKFIVQNPSINGDTTRMALERMPHDVQSHKVDILIVEFGMNDCNYWETDQGVPRVSPAAFKANMHEIISRARAVSIPYILIHTNHPSTKDNVMINTNFRYFESNRAYNDIIRQVARDEMNSYQDVFFTDIEEAFIEYATVHNNDIGDFVLPDGVHLNERGHELYFEAIYKTVKCILVQIGSDSKKYGMRDA